MTRRTTRFGLAAAVALMFQVPVEAQSEEVQVVAKHQWYQVREWLWVAKPDRDGSYGVRISIGDLDLTAASGERALRRRVDSGIGRACWVLSSPPKSVLEGECTRDLRPKFRSRVETVIAMAQSGERTAFLELGSPTRRSAKAVAL